MLIPGERRMPPEHLLGFDAGAYQLSVKGEDRHMTLSTTIGGDSLLLIMVADGHGGYQGAQHTAARLLPYIAMHAQDGSAESLHDAVRAGLKVIHSEIRAAGTAGSTVCVCALNATRHEVTAWNLGDSLAIFIEGGSKRSFTSNAHGVHQLSVSHRLAENADEVRRVCSLGAKLGREMVEGRAKGPLRAFPGGVTNTRGLGDGDCGDFISSEPERSATLAVPAVGGALVLCTDGVWDALSNTRVAGLIRGGRARSGAEASCKLVERACRGGLVDDATAVVVLCGPMRHDDATDLTDRAATEIMAIDLEKNADAAVREAHDDRQSTWTVYDGGMLAIDVRKGTGREACAAHILAASKQRHPQSAAARVVRSWRLLGSPLMPKVMLQHRAVARRHSPSPALAQASASAPSQAGATPSSDLMAKVRNAFEQRGLKGGVAVAKACLELGLPIDSRGTDGDGLLHMATRYGAVDFIRHALKLGASKELRNAMESTPLHCAASCEQEEVVAGLLEARCEVDPRAKYSATPLHLAAARGHLGIVRLLLDRGAQADARDEMEMTAAMHAKAFSHRAVMQTLKGAERLQLRMQVPMNRDHHRATH